MWLDSEVKASNVLNNGTAKIVSAFQLSFALSVIVRIPNYMIVMDMSGS